MSKENLSKEKQMELDKLMKDLTKNSTDPEGVSLLSEVDKDHPSITTGILGLDKITGIGGYPKSRIVEIYGAESSGKTTLALAAVAAAQREGKLCGFIDVEYTLDYQFAARLGVDPEKLIKVTPESAEEAFSQLETMIRSNLFSIIVLDSVAALTPQAELDGDMTDQQVANQARVITKALRKINPHLKSSDTTVIMLNQLRDNIGAMAFAPQSKTAGGRALKFWASMRLSVARISQIKDSNLQVGNKIRVKVEKNKMSTPGRTFEGALFFTTGVSNEESIITEAVEYGLLQKKGAYYSSDLFEESIQGQLNMVKFLRENPDVANELVELIRNEYKKEGIRLSFLSGDYYEEEIE